MNETQDTGRLTSGERLNARMLRLAPPLAFLLLTLPTPLFFLWRYFTAVEDAGVWMLFALTTFALGAVAGLLVALLIVFYRRRWENRLRERLAADGITADELSWFQKDLTPAERRTLKEMGQHNRLLADAYRETLAARLTASRVLSSAERDTRRLEERQQQAATLQGSERARLEEDLRDDRARLERITQKAQTDRAELETRLHMIEAAASRDLSEAETSRALLRLDMAREHTPYALDSARDQFQANEQIDLMLREDNATRTEGETGKRLKGEMGKQREAQ